MTTTARWKTKNTKSAFDHTVEGVTQEKLMRHFIEREGKDRGGSGNAGDVPVLI